jgi:pyruvate, water dikinase
MKKKISKNILWLKEISSKDWPLVGRKNASLGEMYNNLRSRGINLPNGFAITSKAYFSFLKEAGLEEKIKKLLQSLKAEDINSLQKTGQAIRKMIIEASLPKDLEEEIAENYYRFSKEYKEKETDVAVRASIVAPNLPGFSFAGQQESYLNIRGEKDLEKTIKKCFASLFTDRAIAYREKGGFSHWKVALSIGINKMIRSDLGAAGTMFTLEPESGFSNLILISSAYGLGQSLVRGKVTPEEYWVFKPGLKKNFASIIKKVRGQQKHKLVYGKRGTKQIPLSAKEKKQFSLSDKEVLTLAKWGIKIEDYYSQLKGSWDPRDIEWAKDGRTNELFIVESRPETIHRGKRITSYNEYKLLSEKKALLEGVAIGEKIVTGRVRVIKKVSELKTFKKGEILVTEMTDPDWVGLMKKAGAIVTDEGARTCHAAIVSRELGIPSVVGTGKASSTLKTGQLVTVSCSGGKGEILKGKIPYQVKKYDLRNIPQVKPAISLNIGIPGLAFKYSFLPVAGVGLVREEFVIANDIGIHPLALCQFSQLKDKALQKKIENLTFPYQDKKQFFVDRLAEGIGQIAAAFWPRPVIVRFSDFKSDEYRQLLGGEKFEPEEDCPMLGWRGASRYYSSSFRPAFQLECRALKKVREEFGLTNTMAMIPFCRTPEEGKKVLAEMKKENLRKNNLKIYVMAEIPANIILADEFLNIFDGLSIGSNDLTQLTLGLDRNEAGSGKIGDARNEAVKKLVAEAIKICRRHKKYSGFCGEAPSNYPDYALFLAQEGIESISVSPSAVIKTISRLAKEGN